MRITVYFTMRFALRLASLSRHHLCYVGGWGWRRRLQRRGLWGRRFRIGMPGPLLLVLTQLEAVPDAAVARVVRGHDGFDHYVPDCGVTAHACVLALVLVAEVSQQPLLA